MKSKARGLAFSILVLVGSFVLDISAQANGMVSDASIRQQMIDASLASYSGNCPCPYNRMSNGRRCGKTSAYIRPRGASPLCYPEDISDSEVQQFKASHMHRTDSRPEQR